MSDPTPRTAAHVEDRGPNGKWWPRCAADLQSWPCDHHAEERRVADLTAAVDHHWLTQGLETGVAFCTCGGWSFDAKVGQAPLPVMGERFAPFSEHVARAILAALRGESDG